MMDDVSGQYAEVDEPDFDAPPAFAEQDERRMHVRAYNHWAALLAGREFPAPGDIKPEEIDDFGPNSVLLDFAEDRDNPILRYVGDRLRHECDLDDEEIGYDKVPPRSLLSRLTDHYFEIIANRAPIGFEAEFTNTRGNTTMYRGILMPLSTDGRTIDYICGVINWKEVAEAELQSSLQIEAGIIENAPPAGDLEALLIGEGAAASEPAPLGAAAAELPADAGLADRVAFARDVAQQAGELGDRSRQALYDALGHAYDVWVASRAEPDLYAELLEDYGITVQARAPLTPVAKLIFGADYDKTRLTEFSAALAHAVRHDVAEGGFGAFLAAADGGLKGLVKAERAARRAESAKPMVDIAANRRAKLRAAPASAQVDLFAPGEDEFVLVVARREADGRLGLLGTVTGDDALVDKAIRKLG